MRRAGRAWVFAGIGAVVVGIASATLMRRPVAAASPVPSFVFPERLSHTGLYRADGTIDTDNRSFSPQYPLWTDGATKRRWVRLPEGSRIDTHDPDGWRFPAGTMFWKEFSFHGRKVETRMIRILDDGSAAFASYAWNAEGTDAVLAPEFGIPRAFEVASGKWHAIPGPSDCRNCHESGSSLILGFNALQLSDDRDALAPHAERISPASLTLRTLIAEDRLHPSRTEWSAAPPRLRARSNIERAALGYLSTNCGSCHNARGPLARLGFSLRHDFADVRGPVEPAIATAVGSAGRFAVDGALSGAPLIAPGDAEASAVVHRMLSRRASTQMPPLGTVLVDSAGVALVRAWIRGLSPTP